MLSGAAFSSLRCLFILLTFLSVGCATSAPPKAQVDMREYFHPNGLVIKLNDDLSATETENGFLVEPSDGSNRNVRFPIEIRVSLIKNKKLPENASFKRKDVGNRKIDYSIEKTDGGSGGETYTFRAFEKTADGYLEFLQTSQSEYSEPDFQTVWKIIENTSPQK